MALDVTLTPELIAQGNVREAIRMIQDERKAIGLDVSDRIKLRWNASPEARTALDSSAAYICEEVLAISMELDHSLEQGENDLGLKVAIVKA